MNAISYETMTIFLICVIAVLLWRMIYCLLITMSEPLDRDVSIKVGDHVRDPRVEDSLGVVMRIDDDVVWVKFDEALYFSYERDNLTYVSSDKEDHVWNT